jgi:hypothetical protein
MNINGVIFETNETHQLAWRKRGAAALAAYQ